jgi:hypothetical protein
MSTEPISSEAKLLIQLGEMVSKLWKARDRAWKLARERNHWKRENLEQAKLLAMSADREEKLRMELQQARDCFSAAMELAERYKTERDEMQ